MVCGLPASQYVILVSSLGRGKKLAVNMRRRNPADTVSQPFSFIFALLLIVSYCFVRNTSGADECKIKQSGLSAGFVEELRTCYLHS